MVFIREEGGEFTINVVIANNVRVYNPSDELMRWAKRELTIPNPEYTRKARLGLWLGKTPRNFELFGMDGKCLVLPYGTRQAVCERCSEKDSIYDTTTTLMTHIGYGSTDNMTLYDYQTEAVQSMINAGNGILQSPAGSGKTQMGIALIKKLGLRTLWLCHTADLLKQSKERAEQYITPELMGTITEGKVHIGTGITFATIQTMCNLDLVQYRTYWDMIIVDECHRIAGSPTQVTRYYKVLNNLQAHYKIGLTATPERADGMFKAVTGLLGRVAHAVSEETVAEKIMKVQIMPISAYGRLTDKALNPDGTLNYAGFLTSLARDEARNQLIANKIIESQGASCLILSDRIEQLEGILQHLPYNMLFKSEIITAKTYKKLRDDAIEKMRIGERKYLFASYSLAKEGLDIPRLSRLFLASPVKYHATVIQSIGRVARRFPGKETPIAYDFVDVHIPFCVSAYKERCKHYRQAGLTIL